MRTWKEEGDADGRRTDALPPISQSSPHMNSPTRQPATATAAPCPPQPVTHSRIFPFLHSKSAGGGGASKIERGMEGTAKVVKRSVVANARAQCALLELQGRFVELTRYMNLSYPLDHPKFIISKFGIPRSSDLPVGHI